MSNDQNDAYDDDFERNEDNAGKDNNFDKNNCKQCMISRECFIYF